MPQDIQPRVAQQVATPPTSVLPTAREMRAEVVHRLQVGLFGLCAMLLLVGLANIIMDRARLSDDENASAPVAAAAGAKAATDPLADIGVVPAADPSAAAQDKGQ